MVVRHHVREHSRRTKKRQSTHVRDHWRGSGSRALASGEPYHGEAFLRGGKSTELTSEQRTELHRRFPDAFVFPEDEAYPVPTVHQLEEIKAPRPAVSGKRHALNALQRVDQHGTLFQVSHVVATVKSRYPGVYEEWRRNRK